MEHNTHQFGRPAWLRNVVLPFSLLLPVFVAPVILSTSPKGGALGILSFALLFFFPGYLLLSMVSRLGNELRLLLSLVFGITCITTAYSFFAQATMVAYFLYFVVALSIGGLILAAIGARRTPALASWLQNDFGAVVAGAAVALSIAPLYWRSGRFSGPSTPSTDARPTTSRSPS